MIDRLRQTIAYAALAWLVLAAIALAGCVLPWQDNAWRGPGIWGVLSDTGRVTLLLALLWFAQAAMLIRFWATTPYARPLDAGGARRAWGVATAILTPAFLAWAVPLVATWHRTRAKVWWFGPAPSWTPSAWVSEIASHVSSRPGSDLGAGFWVVLASLMTAVLTAAVVLPGRLRAACAQVKDPGPQASPDPNRVARWHLWLCLLGVLGPCIAWLAEDWPRLSPDRLWRFLVAEGQHVGQGLLWGCTGMLAVCLAATCMLLLPARWQKARALVLAPRLLRLGGLTLWAAYPALAVTALNLDQWLDAWPPTFYVGWFVHLLAYLSCVLVWVAEAVFDRLANRDRPAEGTEHIRIEDPTHRSLGRIARFQIAMVLVGLGAMLLPWEPFRPGWFTLPGERLESATGLQLLWRAEWNTPDHGIAIVLTGMFLVVLKAAWVLARTRWPVVPRVSATELLLLWAYALLLDLIAAWLWIGPHAFNSEGIASEHGYGRLVHAGTGAALLLVSLAVQPYLLHRTVLARGRREEAADLSGR